MLAKGATDSSADRHQQAIDNSLLRAQVAAGEGRLDDALAWLDLVLTVDGALPVDWQTRRREWQAARNGLRRAELGRG
jgi:hypothetical protein